MSAMLEVADLHAYYGKSHILQGVTFAVGEGEIVSMLGRNGVGRSTTLKAIMGNVAPHGAIVFKKRPIAGMRPFGSLASASATCPRTARSSRA
jgi:branched-chain amino acid transport system ATP-binding protein